MSGHPCPHGDPTCPCQDGDACHYETSFADGRPVPALRCPNPPYPLEPIIYVSSTPGIPDHVDDAPTHCHVEGCGYGLDPDDPSCGMDRLGFTGKWNERLHDCQIRRAVEHGSLAPWDVDED